VVTRCFSDRLVVDLVTIINWPNAGHVVPGVKVRSLLFPLFRVLKGVEEDDRLLLEVATEGPAIVRADLLDLVGKPLLPSPHEQECPCCLLHCWEPPDPGAKDHAVDVREGGPERLAPEAENLIVLDGVLVRHPGLVTFDHAEADPVQLAGGLSVHNIHQEMEEPVLVAGCHALVVLVEVDLADGSDQRRIDQVKVALARVLVLVALHEVGHHDVPT
jgi:hypothetical protein